MPTIPPGRTTDWLAGVTIAVWVLASVAGFNDYLIALAGFMPARLSGTIELAVAVPALLTPWTSALLHGGLLHLGFNMLMLFYCGRFVERVIGGPLLLLLYAAGALGAAAAQFLPDPQSLIPTIGASGALSAVVAAYAIYFGRGGTRAVGPFSAHASRVLSLAAAWIGIQALVGFATVDSGVSTAIAAHVGGFLTGLLLARPLLLWRYRAA